MFGFGQNEFFNENKKRKTRNSLFFHMDYKSTVSISFFRGGSDHGIP